MSKMGTPRYGQNTKFKKRNYFNVSQAPQVFAIIPPIKDLADDGIWSRFYSVHFGYKNSEGKLRTFLSTQVKKGKMVDVPDPALDRLTHLKLQLEEAKKANNAPLVARLNGLVGMKGVYNVDNNHHMNAHDLEGNVGVLKIRHKHKVLLDKKIEELRADGIEPLSTTDGRYFVFSKSGQGPETIFTCDVYTKDEFMTGSDGKSRKVPVPVARTMDEKFVNKCIEEGADLNTLFQKVTPEECKQIVDNSELLTGKSPACDVIFDARWKAQREAKSAVVSTMTQATAPSYDQNPEDETPSDDYTAPSATIEPVKVSESVVAQEAKAAAEAPLATTTAPAFETLSEDEFYAQIGLKK